MINSNKILKEAYDKKFAIGAFNVYNMESIQAVVEACNNLKSPVILQVTSSTIRYAGIRYISKMVEIAVENAKIPVVLHLDHGNDFETCKNCIDNGFTSVMIDGSALEFEKNVEITQKVVDYAHRFDISVEGELGRLAGIEDFSNVVSVDKIYTDPVEAKKFIELTNVDSLAVSIGTSHGAYKHPNPGGLNFDILKKIVKCIPGVPLVLHGASSIPKKICDEINKFGGNLGSPSGISESDLRKCATMGICKINIDSDLRLVSTAAIRKYFHDFSERFDPRNYLSYAKSEMKKMVEYKIKNILSPSKY